MFLKTPCGRQLKLTWHILVECLSSEGSVSWRTAKCSNPVCMLYFCSFVVRSFCRFRLHLKCTDVTRWSLSMSLSLTCLLKSWCCCVWVAFSMQGTWRRMTWKKHVMHSNVHVQYIYRRRPVFIWRGQHLKNVKVVLAMIPFNLIVTFLAQLAELFI